MFKITWKTQIKCTLLAILIVLLLNKTIYILIENFMLNDFILLPTKYIIINMYIYVIALFIPIAIVHELVHGITFKIFGGKVKYGFKIIYAYTQEITEKSFSRFQFSIVLLMPLVIISIISIFLNKQIGGMIFLLNLLGSTGDIYMAFTLCRLNYYNKIIDRSYGYDII